MLQKYVAIIGTILGLSIPCFGALLALYFQIWHSKKADEDNSHKPKLKIPLPWLLAFVAISILVGYGTYRLINHGKDKDYELRGFVQPSVEYEMTPSYAIIDSKVYRASAGFEELTTDHTIVLTNTNDLDISILNIEIIIEEYQSINPDYIFYFEPEGGHGDAEYNVFWGSVTPNQNKVLLKYIGQGIAIMTGEDVKDNHQTNYMKIDANSEANIYPHVQFLYPGLYEIHYNINYSLNGEKRVLSLPNLKMYAADWDTFGFIPFVNIKLKDVLEKHVDKNSRLADDMISILKDNILYNNQ